MEAPSQKSTEEGESRAKAQTRLASTQSGRQTGSATAVSLAAPATATEA